MALSGTEDGHDHLFKLIVIGDSGVGKSSLLSRFTRGKFRLDPKPTTTNNIVSRHVYIHDKVIKAQIVDIAGNHRYCVFSNDVQAQNADGVLIVYDVTNYSTFENVEKWYGELHIANSELEVMLIGNKSDLVKDSVTNLMDAGKAFAERASLSFIETSAKDDRDVEKAFVGLVTRIFRQVFKNVSNNDLIDAPASPAAISSEAGMFISKRKHEPAHYMLKIESFSLLREAQMFMIESDIFEASGHKWRLDLYPNGNEEENEGKHIALYVVICDTESLPKGWKVCVDVCFFVYDHIRQHYVTFQHADRNRTRFHEKKKEWGFDELISRKLFMESGNGYLLNDSCVFGAEVFIVPEYAGKDRCLTMIKPPATMNTHTWTIDNFSDITDMELQSEIFKIGKVEWKLSLYPKGDGECDGTYLSLYLCVVNDSSLPVGWRVLANFKLRVESQNNVDQERDFTHWFCHSFGNWGHPCLLSLSELTDAGKGFLLNDTLIVAAEISCVGIVKNFI